MLESSHALSTKVVRNVTITALTKIQHFCIRVERTTEFSVSVVQLPGQLGNFPQIAFFEHAKWKFAVVLKANFEACEMLHLLNNFGEYFSDCAVGFKKLCECVAAIVK
jgi:hypothetical protein